MSTDTASKRSWAEVNLDAVVHNARLAKQLSGHAIMAVVKADAYGHGAVQVAHALAAEATLFGVANYREAEELRQSGISHPIMILGACLPTEEPAVLKAGFQIGINAVEQALRINDLAGSLGIKAHAHLLMDTGMGRLGFLENQWDRATIEQLAALPNIVWEGIASHLPVPDEDVAYTIDQMARFKQRVDVASGLGLTPFYVHIANSAGILGYQEYKAYSNLVRPGLLLYGISPLPEQQELLRSTLTWKTRVAAVRELPPQHGVSYGRTFITTQPTRVATLSCGYADGYPRQVSCKGAYVLLQGVRCPLLGRVTMDQIMVDVSHLPQPAELGDEVVLAGWQGENEISPNELALLAGTIPWDIFTGIGKRVERVYVADAV